MARKLRGNTTIDMVNAGIAERKSFNPKIGTTTTISRVAATGNPSIGQSYNKMIGGDTGIGEDGFYNSISGLEGASMRLADAESKRKISEKQKELELQESYLAKNQGYFSPSEKYSQIRKKRIMEDGGYFKSGGRWIKQK